MVEANAARVVLGRCEILAGYSEEPDRLTRRVATPALRQAGEAVAGWLRDAGMSVRRDAIGNVVGRYEAATGEHPAGARTLLLGSHLDTVRDAGKYDGPLGVLVAIACVQGLHDRGERLPFAIEVVAFADEEGLRFGTAFLGGEVFIGSFDPDNLSLTDADGVSLAEAVRADGGDPDALGPHGRSSDDLLGYCEVHIEQGPVLEANDLPVGVVTAIAGQGRFEVRFIGEAGHAGTVPMGLRRDALCAAAEFVLATEAIARGQPGLVATVGRLAVQPGASNVIPGEVALSLDVRHQDDAVRADACGRLREAAERIGAARRIELRWEQVSARPTVPCSAHLGRILARAIEARGLPAFELASGAGHDAVTLAGLTDIAMLFVRCRGGVSHNPAEAVSEEDVAVAFDVLGRFVGLLAREVEPAGRDL
jgi:allantoate deiminase